MPYRLWFMVYWVENRACRRHDSFIFWETAASFDKPRWVSVSFLPFRNISRYLRIGICLDFGLAQYLISRRAYLACSNRFGLVWLNVAPGINSRYLTLDIGILKLNLTPFFLGIFIYLSICEKLSTSQKNGGRVTYLSI